jgi:SAM-dependent methyltransferase
MNLFKDYARYYDYLYKDKDYFKEVNYVESLVKRYSFHKVKKILDLGCGTGNHATYLAKKGYYITGIDLSKEMIKIAKLKQSERLQFHEANLINMSLKNKYDLVYSLFHVINYLTSNENLEKAFKQVKNYLQKGGLFIFDSWYGPAVLADKPKIKIKNFEDDTVKIVRIATPKMYPNENIVEVNYKFVIEDKKSKGTRKFNERHIIRYLFRPEIESFFKAFGIELVDFQEWLTGKQPGFGSWSVCFVGRKL